MTPSPYELVDNASRWKACLRRLRDEPRVAVDLEANSLYAYQERICLIQISIPGQDFIIDPLAGFPLNGFGKILANPDIEKIFHSSDYDLMLLKFHHEWEVTNLFDTMWAGRILGHTNMGLAWFLDQFFDIQVNKRHQKADWGKRPLTESQLSYAQRDTYYLLPLRDEMARQLEEAGQMDEAREIFANECRIQVKDRSFDTDGFWRLPGARHIEPQNQAILRALFLFRDRRAKRRDVPPFKVMSNRMLLEMADNAPTSVEEMLKLDGLPAKIVQRYGARMLTIIDEAREAAPPQPPKRKRRNPPDVAHRYSTLQEWRKETAIARGVESDVVISREGLWEIARLNPTSTEELEQVPSLGPIRHAMYAQGILNLLKNKRT